MRVREHSRRYCTGVDQVEERLVRPFYLKMVG